MYNCFLSQLLILILLLTSSCRIFFIKTPRIDCLAIFSLISLIISIINIFVFEFSFTNIILTAISFFCVLTNFRSMLKLHANLFVDHYSKAFFVCTIISLLLITTALFFIIFYRPVQVIPEKFNVEKTVQTLSGRSLNNLVKKDSPFSGELTSAYIYTWKPSAADEITEYVYSRNPILIFSGTPAAPSGYYEPLFILLAQKGYTVIAGDFYTKDLNITGRYFKFPLFNNFSNTRILRRFCSLYLYQFQKENYTRMIEEDKKKASQRYLALSKFINENTDSEKQFVYLFDEINFDSISEVMNATSGNYPGFFTINRISEYETPGFGFLEQTNPLLAKTFNLKRDKSLFIPRYVAKKIIEHCISIPPKPHPSESENNQTGEQ